VLEATNDEKTQQASSGQRRYTVTAPTSEHEERDEPPEHAVRLEPSRETKGKGTTSVQKGGGGTYKYDQGRQEEQLFFKKRGVDRGQADVGGRGQNFGRKNDASRGSKEDDLPREGPCGRKSGRVLGVLGMENVC